MTEPVALPVYCSTINKSQALEAAQVPTTDEWIKKMWYLYTMDCYSAIKKNKIMLFVGKWVGIGEHHVK
jgi:predicted transglutaminase-like protease